MSDYFTGCEVCETNARTYGVMTAERKVDELEAEVARLRAEVADLKAAAQWRPIEEAPKDGREVLVTYRNRGQVQFADYSGHKWWKRGPGREPLIPQPTHYLAIPALPEGGV